MTATIVSRAPAIAGGAVANAASRLGLWALARIASAPFTSAGLIALTVGGLLAGGNALYWQPERHPAPLHFPWTSPAATEAPVIPAGPPVRRHPASITTPKAMLPVLPPARTTPAQMADRSVTTGSTGRQVTNADVASVQRKLTELGYFSGQIDGLFGSRTAAAIRSFEAKAGMAPKGMLTPEVVDTILGAPQANVVAAAAGPSVPKAAEPAKVAVRTASVTPSARSAIAQGDPIGALVKSATDESKLAANPSGASQIVSNPIGTAQAKAAQEMGPAPAGVDKPTVQLASTNAPEAISPAYIRKVQQGLASLGFLQGPIDGKPGTATAEAIRHFEVFFDYKVTGKITPDLVRLLDEAGAKT